MPSARLALNAGIAMAVRSDHAGRERAMSGLSAEHFLRPKALVKGS
jgi:hypothetical protein